VGLTPVPLRFGVIKTSAQYAAPRKLLITPNFMIKDLPLVLILIIADQILNGLCRFIGKLYILILTFLKYLSEKGKSFGLTLSRIK